MKTTIIVVPETKVEIRENADGTFTATSQAWHDPQARFETTEQNKTEALKSLIAGSHSNPCFEDGNHLLADLCEELDDADGSFREWEVNEDYWLDVPEGSNFKVKFFRADEEQYGIDCIIADIYHNDAHKCSIDDIRPDASLDEIRFAVKCELWKHHEALHLICQNKLMDSNRQFDYMEDIKKYWRPW